MTDNLPTIGWIGAGRMGTQLIQRLLHAGYDVAVYNRTAAKVQPLVDAGATHVARPADLTDRDIVFSMVSADKDLEAVLLGADGLLAGASGPRILADVSTVSMATSEKVRSAASERGTAFLATPVSGNPAVIAAGKLTVAVSGPRAVFDEIEPVLQEFGRGVTYVGEGEVARLVKIAHNVFLGVVTQSLAEITVLAEKGGVSRAAFLTFLNESVMGSIFTGYKTPAFVNLDFTPTFTMPLLQKDFDLGLDAAYRLGAPMPVASATRQIVAQQVGEGNTERDFATLLVGVARGAGLELQPENADVTDGLED
ncbi:NAD(P)-dependent oxidoreductase [Microbacterium sp. zg-Y818]|uniref:NAD(P)-dependent oxidoreductase n=1 Tax=unclassified Microbacterium TaxID=2609290 RepID=UPI00214B1EF1|nr:MULTISPECIES: NAD(P)-dependent oxidoreductase [unclassified Microbacterium]MCR2799544.1 NAD(P)-dependent oxidoreductase [Microbacterium sp. zg.Y818]WIM21538.1 NAD(P)-dependent oxidoreductase [Microbacterium sp. zg-Y818]